MFLTSYKCNTLIHCLSYLSTSKTRPMAYILPINPFMKFLIFTIFCIILATGSQAEDPYLTLEYYKSSCPSVLDIVKREMECAVLSDPRNAAIILRLHFHDCFVQVSASVAIDSPATSRQYGTYGCSTVTVKPLWTKNHPRSRPIGLLHVRAN